MKPIKRNPDAPTLVEIVPAAVNSLTLNDFIAVKYSRPKGKQPFTAERIKGVDTMYLPDRIVYSGSSNVARLAILETDVDAFTLIGPISNPESLKFIGYNYMMVTPERQATSDYVRRNGLVKMFSDSGGFQLSKGVTEFIELDKVVDFYRRKIDYGIGLDVPLPFHLQSTDWFARMAKITVANNKYIAEGLKGSPAKLYDVSHGLTLERRKEFLKIVMDNQAGVGLAMGGIGQSTYDTAQTSTVMAVINMCYVIDKAKKQYERFHILGTTSPFMVSVYHMLTKLGVAPLITADSSTYAQTPIAFATKGMKFSVDYHTPAHILESTPLSYGLPCNCKICSMVGYPQVYRMRLTANAYHNLHVMYRAFHIIEDYITALLAGEKVLPDLLRTIDKTTTMYPLYTALYRFVLDMPKGFDKAYALHRDKLSYVFRRDYNSKGLFANQKLSLPAGLIKAESNVTKAIVRYEEFHGIGKKSKGRK